MMRQTITIFFLLATLLACNSSAEKQILFETGYSVEGELFLPIDRLADPRQIQVTDKYLILANNKGEPQVEVYDISTRELLSAFLSVGNGPDEVLLIGNMQIDEKNGSLYVADLHRRRLFQYNMDDVAKNDNIITNIAFERGDDSPLLYDKMFIGKDHFIAESRDPKGRIILIDKKTREASYHYSYPDKKHIEIDMSDIDHAGEYASAISVSPSQDMIVMGTYIAGMLDICRIKNGEIIPVWNNTIFHPQGQMAYPMGESAVIVHTQESRSGYLMVCSTDDYTYALYSGKKFEDKTYGVGNEVHVVSWSGKEAHKIVLDHSLTRISVDSNNEFIYGITPGMDVMRFPIKK